VLQGTFYRNADGSIGSELSSEGRAPFRHPLSATISLIIKRCIT
jgi:hypothetical protein